MQIHGQWHPAGKSTRLDACLWLEQDRYRLSVDQLEIRTGLQAGLVVDDTLSRLERRLILPDESTFTTADVDGFEQVFRPTSLVSRVVRRIEANIVMVLLAVILTLAAVVAGVKWGLPWAAHGIANALPAKTNEIIGANALEFLDEYFFTDSKIDSEQQALLAQRFKTQLLPLIDAEAATNFSLHFRELKMGGIPIPNAMALPSGEIILTDRLVQLAANYEEIDAVLLHEIGHVVHRHSLERIVNSALITVAIALVTGGAESGSGLVDIGVGLGVGLVNSSYSRAHETEADLFAFEYSFEANIDPMLLADILTKMEQDFELSRAKSTEQEQEQENDGKTESQNQYSVVKLFSSHPPTPERAAMASRFSDCYAQGIAFKNCH